MLYDFVVESIDGNKVSLSEYKGKVLLIVNTATKCGYTPQYEGLEKIYQKYKDRGFEVLDFPCNQFLGQAPGSNEEIQNFCSVNYHITFPQFAKIKVNGKDAHPLYEYLKEQKPSRIKWNFTKFLVDREGNVVERFDSKTKIEEMEESILALL